MVNDRTNWLRIWPFFFVILFWSSISVSYVLFLTSTKLAYHLISESYYCFLIYHALSLYMSVCFDSRGTSTGRRQLMDWVLVSGGLVLLFLVGNYALFTYAPKTLPPRKKKPVSKKKLKGERLRQGISAPGEWTRCPPKWSRESPVTVY